MATAAKGATRAGLKGALKKAPLSLASGMIFVDWMADWSMQRRA